MWGLSRALSSSLVSIGIGLGLGGILMFDSWASTTTASTNCPLQNFQEDIRESKQLSIAPWQIPHDMKKYKGGEDTYFISQNGCAFGVFDGVSGWAAEGVDPREYSYQLMLGATEASNLDNISCEEILNAAYKKAEGTIGSSTACIITVDGEKVNSANLGDSGYCIFRDEQLIFKSVEQQHFFNCPYQLGSRSVDKPSDANKQINFLEEGDIIVVGTDGLFDNLYHKDIEKFLTDYKDEPSQFIARELANKAYSASKNNMIPTPFSDAARANGLPVKFGGKPDDITIIVAKYNKKAKL